MKKVSENEYMPIYIKLNYPVLHLAQTHVYQLYSNMIEKVNLKRKWNAYSIPLKLQEPRLFHISGAWAALVPKFGLSRGWGSCWSMCQQMTLQDPWACSAQAPVNRMTRSGARQDHSQLNLGKCTQGWWDGGPSRPKYGKEAPGLQVSCCWGSHLHPPSLGLPQLWTTAHQQAFACLGCLQWGE